MRECCKNLFCYDTDQILRDIAWRDYFVGKARDARPLTRNGPGVRGLWDDIGCHRQTTMHQGAPGRLRQTRPMAAPEAGDSLRSGHAVVLGGSMAGLLAARALAYRFSRVTVVERDAPPATPAHRKGVPQDQHIHVLLSAGATILENFFPGFKQELLAAGALTFDCGSAARWFHHGVWKNRAHAGVLLLAQSRPFLEWHVRRRLAALPNVAFVAGDGIELLPDADGGRVRGARVRRRDGSGVEEDCLAELIVETSGRGSHVPKRLNAMDTNWCPRRPS